MYGVGGTGKHDGQYGWHSVPPWTGAPQIGIPFHADQKGKHPVIPMDLTAQAHEYFQSPLVKNERKGGKKRGWDRK